MKNKTWIYILIAIACLSIVGIIIWLRIKKSKNLDKDTITKSHAEELAKKLKAKEDNELKKANDENELDAVRQKLHVAEQKINQLQHNQNVKIVSLPGNSKFKDIKERIDAAENAMNEAMKTSEGDKEAKEVKEAKPKEKRKRKKASKAEQEAYDVAKQVGTVQAYESFIENEYPTKVLKGVAKMALTRLRKKEKNG